MRGHFQTHWKAFKSHSSLHSSGSYVNTTIGKLELMHEVAVTFSDNYNKRNGINKRNKETSEILQQF